MSAEKEDETQDGATTHATEEGTCACKRKRTKQRTKYAKIQGAAIVFQTKEEHTERGKRKTNEIRR